MLAESWPADQFPDEQGFQVVNLVISPFLKFSRLLAFARSAAAWLAGPGGRRDAAVAVDRVPGVEVFWTAEGSHAAWLEARSRYASGLRRLSFRLNPLHRTHLRLEREMFRHPNLRLVVANSTRVRDDLARLHGLASGLVRILPSGIDPARVRPPNPRETAAEVRAELNLGDSPVILFVGSGFERKGLRFAIESLRLMKNSQAVLLAVGKDSPGPYLSLARRLGLAGRIRLIGVRSDVPRLLCAADAFVLPTIYDPGAISCLEALVAGVPVVTTRANGSADFLEPGLNGFVLDDPADSSNLAAGLDSALSLKPASFTPLADVPTLEQQAQALSEMLQQVAAEKKPGPI
jgi:UDP-glucose:(heptosyl)LPS alpha-1,3-glucosyltransferase